MIRRAPPFVYFVRRVDGEGPVKIGCSLSPADRLAALMVWSPYQLEVVATVPGDETLERRFHAAFADQHSHREWFRSSPALVLALAQLQAGTFDIDALPGPSCVTAPSYKGRMSENARRGMGWSQRLRHLARRGVVIPEEVRLSSHRWSAGRYYCDYNPHNPADAVVVEAFLENHPRKSR